MLVVYCFQTFCLVETACSFATESKHQTILTKAAEVFPLVVYLFDDDHSKRSILQTVKKRIDKIFIIGDKKFVESFKAIGSMHGSVNTLIMDADQLSLLPGDIIDELRLKINVRVEVDKSSPPGDHIAYSKKLIHLQNLANSLPGRKFDVREVKQLL